MTVLVTGAAGFIGMHVSKRLLDRAEAVVGMDNLNDYYDVSLKQSRLAILRNDPGFSFEHVDIVDMSALVAVMSKYRISRVIHLAAQAGVRYSITNPLSYGSANLVGYLNILEACRQHQVEHLVYASSSSVYGNNHKLPFSESDNVDHPVSLYAATKKANELMAHSYSHLYGLPTSGLRLFTVYGPWGRPDMSPIIFTRAIFEGRPIELFNDGQMQRDFTYVDDVVEGIIRILNSPPSAQRDADGVSRQDDVGTAAPWRVLNIGNRSPVKLMEYVSLIERLVGKSAIINLRPMQAGDMIATYADTSLLRKTTGFEPETSLESGLERLVEWVSYYYHYQRGNIRY